MTAALVKYPESTARVIRALHKTGRMSYHAIAARYGLPHQSVPMICNVRKLPPDNAESMEALVAWHEAGHSDLKALPEEEQAAYRASIRARNNRKRRRGRENSSVSVIDTLQADLRAVIYRHTLLGSALEQLRESIRDLRGADEGASA